MKVEMKEHIIYKEWKKAKEEYKKMKLPLIIDRWQYIYSSEKGKISLIKCLNYFHKGHDFWEMYCLEGNLFEDTERFSTKKDAEKTIKLLLKE